MEHRLNWGEYFMLNAHLISMRSTCDRLRVGAVIVKNKRIVATGYNGSVSGSSHCIDDGCYVDGGHCIRTIHAESNALLQCSKFGISTEGTELYVTHFPCVKCTKEIIQAGIKKIYYSTDYKNHDYSYQLLKDAGIMAIQMDSQVDFGTYAADTEEGTSGHLTWFFARGGE